MKTPPILVTGARGFLGSALVEYFRREGREVVGLSRGRSDGPAGEDGSQVTDYSVRHLGSLFTDLQPVVVIHAAGGASVPASIADPKADFAAGPALVANILEAVRLTAPTARLVFLSSAAVYGDPSRLPVDEGEELRPLSPYGHNKAASEALCRQYWALHSVPCAIARIFSAYGPGLRRQVVWDLCKKLTSGDEVVRLQGTGAESRDFIHARDVAEAIDAILKNGKFDGTCYNVASGEETTIADLARCLRDEISPVSELTFDGNLPAGNPTRWCADISALRALGFSPKVRFRDGLREYARWFRENASASS